MTTIPTLEPAGRTGQTLLLELARRMNSFGMLPSLGVWQPVDFASADAGQYIRELGSDQAGDDSFAVAPCEVVYLRWYPPGQEKLAEFTNLLPDPRLCVELRLMGDTTVCLHTDFEPERAYRIFDIVQ